MSTTFKVQIGDTFESIARKVYGRGDKSGFLARANPGTMEPLAPGTLVTVPRLPEALEDTPQTAPSDSIDEVSVSIDGRRFRFWERVSITRSIDAMDSIVFEAPFDHEAPGFRESLTPFSYKPIIAAVGGDRLFTGTMIDVIPRVKSDGKRVYVSGYSTPGVLDDCTAPASAFPLEFNGQRLDGIAEALIAAFGVATEFTSDSGAVFERVAAKPTDRVLSFLAELAKQRGLIISSTETGKLLFQCSTTPGAPVAVLRQGEHPLQGIEPAFSPQEYYSGITGLEPAKAGQSGSQFTEKNPHLRQAVRPFTFTAQDTTGSDLKTAVKAKIGRMVGNMAAYSVEVSTWRDPSGNLWKPNTTIKILAPDAMIYNKYEFLIRSITFNAEKAQRIATLEVVLPGTFSGEIPGSLPWDV